MSDGTRDPNESSDRVVDWILGELPGEESRELQRDAAADATVAQDAAEMRCMIDDLRELTIEPSSCVALAVRNAVDRRLRLRSGSPLQPLQGLVYTLKVAAVAAFVVGGVLLVEKSLRTGAQGGLFGGDAGDERIAHHVPLQVPPRSDLDFEWEATSEPDVAAHPRYLRSPQIDPDKKPLPYKLFHMEERVVQRYAPANARVEETLPRDVWLCATNALASMRQEFTNRFNPNLRRRAIRAAGGSAFLAARIETLAGEIAVKIDVAMTAESATVQDVALSVRALLAGGSTLRIGEHQRAVRRCSDWLLERVSELNGGELATALSGLMDVAVVSGSKVSRLISEHVSRLAESIIYSNNEHRPSMLNWQTSAAQLADAGQVLRLAPAFGTVMKEALLARAYLATHLSERIALSTAERPDLLAANLYGFGDLIDRVETERKLSLWHTRDLVPYHYLALHHAAWSRFPLGTGWADFQKELRVVSTRSTPESSTDAAALLLALAVSYAAPGSHELLELAIR